MVKKIKKYKNGLVLGKFFPPHNGHIFLIDTAIENSEFVDVIVCSNDMQNISGDIRYKTLVEIYKNNPNIRIHHMYDGDLPCSDRECDTLDEFYSLWVPEVHKIVNELDVVFTSEDYGDDFARYLGIDHFLVDKERIKYPISGTKIRSNVFDNWEFIPNEMKPFFVKRIVIMGPESVGKSTLTKNLANHFNTNFVEEYGRTVFEDNGNKIGIEDFIPISIGRQKIEDKLIKESNKLLFCDTEDMITYIFSKMFFPDTYKEIESYFLDRIKNCNKYDLYILLKPDCCGVQDGTRQFLDERIEHYVVIKNKLVENNCDFVEIGGSWDDRINTSIEIIKSKFNI